MPKKKTGLGRGLDVLLSSGGASADLPVVDDIPAKPGEGLRQIAVEQILRGTYQPRIHIDQDALQELADSIASQGIVQPLLVRPSGTKYELIAGERRWRAAQLAGLHEVPAVVREIPDEAAAAMSLIENIQRENLNPVEEALALQRLTQEFGLTHEQLAKTVGRSRSAVSNLLRLLELEDETRQLLDEGKLEMGHARALLGLRGRTQIKAARYVISRESSVRDTEKYVRKLKNQDGKPTRKSSKKSKKSDDIQLLENDLSDQLGAPVSIQHSKNGSGKIVIGYTSLDELDGILSHLN